tara:strand:+ start:45 stop:497 length:453 start_codon:yes stop_codon:yes gene_type:complete
MPRQTGSQRRTRQTKNVNKTKTKQVKSKSDGKVYTVTSTDGGKTWGNKTPFTGNLLAARLGLSRHGKEDNKTSKTSKKTTARSRMEAKNREIHGDKKIDALKIKNQKFKDDRAAMNKLRKTDPEAYKKKKKAQRKAANAKALKSRSSTWD